MTDLYGDFHDSDEMEGNDEEIGALGSILSWDDEDDVVGGGDVTGSVSAALDGRESLSKDSLPTLPGYPQQISIVPAPAAPAPGLPQQTQIQPQPQPPQGVEGYQLVSVPVAYSNQSHQATTQTTNQQQIGLAPVTGAQRLQGVQQVQQGQMQLVTTQAGVQVLTAAPGAHVPKQVATQILQSPAPAGTPAAAQVQTAPQISTSVTQQVVHSAPGTSHIIASQPGTQPATYAVYQQPQLVTNRPTILQQSPVQQPQQAATGDPNTFLQVQYRLPPQTASGAQRQVHPTASRMVSVSQGQHIIPSQTALTQPTQVVTSQTTSKRGSKRKSDSKSGPASQARFGVVSASDTDGEPKVVESKSTKKQATVRKKSDTDKDSSEMTQEEKAKANRDRNREHARNTRLRKKAYLEKLKSTVDELCRERDTLVSERAGAANLMVEIHNTRVEVLMSFFALRSTFEKQRDLWSSILDESCFSCVMPVTPYRSFPASEVQVSKCQRTILGIDGMIADTASLHVLLSTLIDRARYPTGAIQFRYTLVTEDAVVAGNQMMARWVMSTLNATQLGARMEVAKQGMLCCKFNSAHKIIGLELMFDVMAFMLQLKQAAGSETFSVVPNTVQTCQRSFSSPMVMTLAERPYTIVQVNKLWEDMTGYRAENVVGKASCRVLQGQETDRASVENLMSSVRYKRPVFATLLNYSRTGKRFRNYLNVYPLSTDSKITHYVALTAHIDVLDGNGVLVPPPAQVQQPTQPAISATNQMPKPAQPIMPPTEIIPQPTTLQVTHPPTIVAQPALANIQTTTTASLQGHNPIPATQVQYFTPQTILSTSTAILPKATTGGDNANGSQAQPDSHQVQPENKANRR